jgi:hypothetical protein
LALALEEEKVLALEEEKVLVLEQAMGQESEHLLEQGLEVESEEEK